jgi:dUTP pyrophosphatase
MTIQFKKLRPNAVIPTRATSRSAGLDLCSIESCSISPGKWRLIRTGLSISLPSGYEGQVRSRSGLALKQGVAVLNSPGTIDADYRGEIGVILINHSPQNFTVLAGDRIAQLVVAKVAMLDIEEVEELDETERGTGGFGSSGV